MSDELDDILSSLDDQETEIANNDSQTCEDNSLNDENVNQFILDKMGSLVDQGIDTIKTIQQGVVSGFEPSELLALSSLISSITKAAETVNKINLQNKKSKTAKELKKIEVEHKSKQLENGNNGNTNILIATRDEIFKQFIEENKQNQSIDAECIDDEEDADKSKTKKGSNNGK